LGNRSQEGARGGFSLVEILILLACMAVLAAILFPMFFQVRRAGYQTKCAANLQQLMSAFNTYSQDWADCWPCPGGLRGNWTYWAQSGDGGIQSYVRQRGHHSVFCCPLMPEWNSLYDPRSYTMNSYLRDPADVEYGSCIYVLKGIRTSNIQCQRDTILLFEGLPLRIANPDINTEYAYIYRCCNWTGVRGYSAEMYASHTINPGSPWHGKYNNYLYTDGHIRARPPGRRTVGRLSTYREMYEWYVNKAYFQTNKWPIFQRDGAALE
jgi:prepilin-type processing-associated H-X9-DG protein